MSKDTNHQTIDLAFRRAGAYTIDLSKLGRDKPDLLVGFAGCERLVEIKTERDERPRRERTRQSTKCARCGRTYQTHRRGTVRIRDLVTGERIECDRFEVKLVTAPRSGGRLSHGQKCFAVEWPGSPVAVVRSVDDVRLVLDEMAGLPPSVKSGSASER